MKEKKVTFKTAANGTVYVYYTLRAYRNKNGKPTSDEVAIGKKAPETGMLIPNRKYFELLLNHEISEKSKIIVDKAKKPSLCRVVSYGNAYTLMEVAQVIGLREILEKCFPS